VEGGYRETERVTRDPEWEFLQKEEDPEYLALVRELQPR
jgi:hypothetical protein